MKVENNKSNFVTILNSITIFRKVKPFYFQVREYPCASWLMAQKADGGLAALAPRGCGPARPLPAIQIWSPLAPGTVAFINGHHSSAEGIEIMID